MTTQAPVLKKLSIIALAAMGVLLVGAIILYKQRILFADAAYIVFNIINYERTSIQFNRYGSFITQIFPYAAVKMHLPLKQVLILYSASFNIFYFLVAGVLYRCRQYALTILMALYYFLIISSSWFWTNNEVHQAIGWMFLFYGVTIYMGTRKANIVLISVAFSLLAFITIFTHFVVIIPTVFLWVYFIIEKNNWPFTKRTTILLSAILVAIIAYKYIDATGPMPSYETGHLHNLTHFSIKDIIKSFNTPVVRVFVYRCLVNYWAATIIFIIGMVVLIQQKQKALAIWTIISFIGYHIIMGLTYGDLDKYVLLFHIESEWASIGIIMAVTFVFFVLPKLSYRNAALLLTFIFLARMAYIASAFPGFNQRIPFNEQIITQMKKKGHTKLAIVSNYNLMTINKLTWGIPYETLITSAMRGEKPQSFFFFVNPDETATIEAAKTRKQFFSGNLFDNISSLNAKYFLIDTTAVYQVMTYEELMQ
ncbi:MAG: hypothetical protein K0Q79_1088 [Flavipsychrobacter sp.]|jgi:hypothetical protein|nr:hypothetical protein [Flavipsychrobacter sp.]